MRKMKLLSRLGVVIIVFAIALLGSVLVAGAQDDMDDGDDTTDTTDTTGIPTETGMDDAEQDDGTDDDIDDGMDDVADDDDLTAVPISATDFANQLFNQFFFTLTEEEQNLVRAVEAGLVPGAGPGERVCAIFAVDQFTTFTATAEDLDGCLALQAANYRVACLNNEGELLTNTVRDVEFSAQGAGQTTQAGAAEQQDDDMDDDGEATQQTTAGQQAPNLRFRVEQDGHCVMLAQGFGQQQTGTQTGETDDMDAGDDLGAGDDMDTAGESDLDDDTGAGDDTGFGDDTDAGDDTGTDDDTGLGDDTDAGDDMGTGGEDDTTP